ncbi:MAG: hypothetical protein Q6K35_03090, partial [Thermostichus sp. DG02_4_bins_136]
ALRRGEHGAHLWVSPVQAEQVELATLGLQPLAQVEGWQLMRRSSPEPDQAVEAVEEKTTAPPQ